MKIREARHGTSGPTPRAIKLTEYGTACSDPSPIAQRQNFFGAEKSGGPESPGILKHSPTSGPAGAPPFPHRPQSANAGQRARISSGVPELALIGGGGGGGGDASPQTGRSGKSTARSTLVGSSRRGMTARDGFDWRDPNFSPSPPLSPWLISMKEARRDQVPCRDTSPSWTMADSDVAKLGNDIEVIRKDHIRISDLT